MIKDIREEIFTYKTKNNKDCKLYIGKETFKRIREEAHPEELIPKSIEDLKQEGLVVTMAGIEINEANFDYGYYLK